MANRIKELRKQKGMTLAEVAKRIGVSESTMQRYESGKISKIKYETMENLANLFQVTPEYLMGWSDASSQQAKYFDAVCKYIGQNDEKFQEIIIEYYKMSKDYKDKFYEFWKLFNKMKN